MPQRSRPWPLLVVLLLACGPLPSLPGTEWPRVPGPGTPSQPDDAAVARFADLLNERRARDGCPRLVWDGRVAEVALDHSRDMARRGYFSHTTPEGLSPFDRLRRAGIAYTTAAENIAQGPATGDDVFAGWLASPGHRQNMLDCRFTHHGVGLHDRLWTHVLIRPPG